jgi:alpha-glucosidase
LQLDVYPGAECAGTLYEDDGHSLDYTRRAFLRQAVRCTMTPKGVSIDFDARVGQFKPWWSQIRVTVHGWLGITTVPQRGGLTDIVVDSAAQTLSFTIAAPKRANRIALAME